MATIAITCNHSLHHDRAKVVATKLAQDLKDRYQLDCSWSGDDVVFKRPGLSGRLHVTSDRVEINVSLGLLLSAMKPTIEREIRAELERVLRGDGADTAA